MTRATATADILTGSMPWDNHACMPLRPFEHDFMPQLERHRAAGFSVVSLNIGFAEQSWEDHIAMAQSFRAWIEDNSEQFILVAETKDIILAKQTNRLGIFFDVEGTAVINGNLWRIQHLYNLGVRWMSLAYNRANIYAGGCLPGEDKGLTPQGFELLDEMQNVGMLVCCSHTGMQSALETINYCENPVIFSHSNCTDLWSHPRNISNEAIELCAKKGGVIGISGVGPFMQKSGVNLHTFLKHIDHIVQRVGPSHAGLGLDYVFDKQELCVYLEKNPDLFAAEDRSRKEFPIIGPERLLDIIRGLTDMGYGETAIANVIGENFLRVAEGVWKPCTNQ